ncbi:hypothetical protein GE061_009829 [Apolygus lucorum]|uniref:Uncharacterized protein n=1 Tax=Apolygus lucorum TaxID=248454 RepID=A0A6A4KEP8_APOLU|nr:hypothetical protein GE061_009829 [Apolygus lucorum]
MTSPQAEEEGVLREWAPLSKFLRQIPLRTRQGIFMESINFTCVSADVDCIALGTSSGHVFWYNRATHEVHQLRTEKSVSPITSVAVVSSVEFMVAAGDKLGVVTIFRVPKDLPDWAARSKEKQRIDRYTIDEVHTCRITALTWSMNGQKLFSGDDSGVVVFTEVDHRMSITRAREVVNEKFKIVQLSYNQHHQGLVVASTLRCIVCYYNKPNWKVSQVGQRERHCLQELGASFVVDENHIPSIFSCRSGLRLWKSNLDGNVEHTIKFKDIVESTFKPVKFLRPLKPSKNPSTFPAEFGKLYHWRDGLLLSHWQNSLVLFDPATIRVVATVRDSETSLTSVATTQKEIFLVLGQRELIRLSYAPDSFDSSLGGVGNLASGEPVSGIPDFSFTPVNGLPLITSPVQNSRVKLTARTANSEPSANEVSFGVDSAILIPSTVAISEGVPELRVDSSRQHQFSSIGQEEFDEIIFTKHKRKKSKRTRTLALDNNRNSGEFNSDDYVSESGSSLTGSMIEVECEIEDPASIHEVDMVLPMHLFPDSRPIDEIVEDFKMKEELLESTIVFPPPLDDLSPASESNNTVVEITVTTKKKDDGIEMGKKLGDGNQPSAVDSSNLKSIPSTNNSEATITGRIGDSAHSGESESIPNSSETTGQALGVSPIESTLQNNDDEFGAVLLGLENGNVTTQEIVSLDSSKFSSTSVDNVIVEEPVGLVENLTLGDAVQYVTDIPPDGHAISPSDPLESLGESFPSYPILYESLFDGWSEMSCPDVPSWVACHSDGVVMCSPTFRAFICEADSWMKLPYEASHFFLSPDGRIGVRIHYSAAYYSNNWRSKSNWKLLSRSVDSVYMHNDKLWFVSQGDLYFMSYSKEIVDSVPCTHKLLKIYGDGETLYAISSEHRLLILREDEWYPVWSFQEKIKEFCYGPNKLFWVIDFDDRVFITDDLKGRYWWQVIVADFKLHEQLSLTSNDSGIYVANAANKSIAMNSTSVSAINWTLSGVKVDCVQMSAEGVFEDKGCVWVLCKGNRLIGIPSSLDSVHHIKAPCKIVCLASRPQALWLLSEDGEVYIKQGISDDNPLGADWKKMNSEQLREKRFQISHLSCGFDVVWACDIRGNILMLVGSPHAISNCSYTPAWVVVDGSALQNHTFTKVYVGPQCHMVWALDNAGNVYVREAIYPDLPVGISWVHVPGLKASHLSISAETVWALGHGGIYKRTGISASNFIGDMWTRVDRATDNLSVTVDEKLLSVDDGRIREYTEVIFPFSDEVVVEKDWTLL